MTILQFPGPDRDRSECPRCGASIKPGEPHACAGQVGATNTNTWWWQPVPVTWPPSVVFSSSSHVLPPARPGSLVEWADRVRLAERQERVLRRWRQGEAECALCGDLGAVSDATFEGVPCAKCGRVGE